MKWYNYLACFFAGFFLLNTVPHLIHGISGDPFPSPFANPPGKGLSSAMVNTLWGLFNLVVGYLLFRAGKLTRSNIWGIVLFFAGVIISSLMLAHTFVEKMSA